MLGYHDTNLLHAFAYAQCYTARPHLPPSLIPLALSMKAAIGEVPIKLPMMLDRPSTQNANVCLGNSFLAFMNPAGQPPLF